MAHKKAGGSSRNGRDSAGRRLGVKIFGGQLLSQVISLFVNEAPKCGQEKASEWVKITLSLQPLRAM